MARTKRGCLHLVDLVALGGVEVVQAVPPLVNEAVARMGVRVTARRMADGHGGRQSEWCVTRAKAQTRYEHAVSPPSPSSGSASHHLLLILLLLFHTRENALVNDELEPRRDLGARFLCVIHELLQLLLGDPFGRLHLVGHQRVLNVLLQKQNIVHCCSTTDREKNEAYEERVKVEGRRKVKTEREAGGGVR